MIHKELFFKSNCNVLFLKSCNAVFAIIIPCHIKKGKINQVYKILNLFTSGGSTILKVSLKVMVTKE